MLQVYINEQLIPESDIIGITLNAEEKLEFNFSNLISAKITVDINNIDKSKYDDTYPGALLNNIAWYNKSFRIYDTVLQLNTWEGRIKNIKRDEGKKKLSIESTNYIKDIVDTICVISLGFVSNVTPAEVIYSILLDVVGLPLAAVNETSFNNAKATQAGHGGYIIINYNTEQNVKCSSVINEILRITSSNLYIINNIIYYRQFSPYAGGQNTLIDESMIVSGSWSDEYNVENIFNDYKVAYKLSDSAINFAVPVSTPGYITLSKSKYGIKYFTVPDEDLESTAPNNYKILLKTAASANYYGDLKLSANHYAKKIAKLNIRKILADDIYLNTFIDVNYDNLIREPMRITERKIDKKYISITAEFLNFPYSAIERDQVKPNAVALISVKNFVNNEIELKWTISEDVGLDYYIIEFSTSSVDFTGALSGQGYSPIIIEDPEIRDGMCRCKLSNLFNTAKYYFRIKVMDTAGNVSDPSNMMIYNVNYSTLPSIIPQYYKTTGDLINGVTIKDGEGSPVSLGLNTYGDGKYSELQFTYSAFYQSNILSNAEGFKKLYLNSDADSLDYYTIQYRTYNNGEYGFWFELNKSKCNGEEMFELINDDRPTQIQFRILYNIPNYYDDYKIYIYNVNQGV